MSGQDLKHCEDSLAGRRVVFVGRLAGMSRREAERLVRQRGGEVAGRGSGRLDLIVVGDESGDLQRATANQDLLDNAAREAIARGEAELVGESDFWARLGLIDAPRGVERLYTPAMLAELVGAPIAAIRHWQRRGVLQAVREVRRLAYFDFQEVSIARKLSQLLQAGCSLGAVNRRLEELARLLPQSPRPLAEPAVVVEGRGLFVRRGEALAEPSGQLLIEFDAAPPATGEPADSGPVAIPFVAALCGPSAATTRGAAPASADQMRMLAAELEESGRQPQAIDVYRAILVSGDFTPDDHFALAELLYAAGDLSAARERYYMAIELDEDFVEARSNLGCVLAEQGDPALAEAAFRGALEYHPDYADAHYHLARLLDAANRPDEAARHWQMFMNLAPASPWADEARERLGEYGVGSRVSYHPIPENATPNE